MPRWLWSTMRQPGYPGCEAQGYCPGLETLPIVVDSVSILRENWSRPCSCDPTCRPNFSNSTKKFAIFRRKIGGALEAVLETWTGFNTTLNWVALVYFNKEGNEYQLMSVCKERKQRA